jgi:hypothetical protein
LDLKEFLAIEEVELRTISLYLEFLNEKARYILRLYSMLLKISHYMGMVDSALAVSIIKSLS